ncbi:putative nucleotidyltransferase substrate binding domain-containing protein [Aliikangiella sp. G2MR2-5]|uniref:putative nucleotidyltransferase substrate binding domain-containing protein n=1 Tax=Aliikangiella sp. G2MR2-5 TaxID=2788943 RepID=UPI0018AAFF8C|nr:putative nucleotidyltransferase substrate binding domain-containing protein [Aliikangiella sp. G2MR2-5]
MNNKFENNESKNSDLDLLEVESLEIFNYLSSIEPISRLSDSRKKQLLVSIEIDYARRGQIILKPGAQNRWLFIIRSGAVERLEIDGTVAARFAENDMFGHASIRRGGEVKREIKALEDTLFYKIPKETFEAFFQEEPYFRFYFERNDFLPMSAEQKRNIGKTSTQHSGNLSSVEVCALLHDKPLMVDHTKTVSECAQLMQSTASTSLLITQNNRVKGIVTDRAFCTKVVAENISHQTPVGVIMSEGLLTIQSNATASEALLIMARNNIRHLPVIENEKILGVLTATDLIHRQSNNPVYLINQIHRTLQIDSLIRLSHQIQPSLLQLVKQGLSANDVAYTISSIGRAFNQQLLNLAELELGKPPIPYVWVIAGSLARNEQTAKSDQDNLIILSDDYEEALHGTYFEKLSKFVCDGLNKCGYIYCPGDVMASNPKWRQPLSQWKQYFSQWILSPEPKSLMYASIFFDLNGLHGEHSLLAALNIHVKEVIVQNKMFLNFMAANALHHTPPLGLFRNFVLERHGSEEKSLDLKKRGVVPIIDLSRVYALDCGARPINTLERLIAARQSNSISEPGLMDLTDAFEFLSELRLQHQAKNIEQGKAPDNYLIPEEISSLERRHLKDTFEVVRTYQSALASRYQTGRIG